MIEINCHTLKYVMIWWIYIKFTSSHETCENDISMMKCLLGGWYNMLVMFTKMSEYEKWGSRSDRNLFEWYHYRIDFVEV